MNENQLNLLCTIIEEYKIIYERVNSIKVDLPTNSNLKNQINLYSGGTICENKLLNKYKTVIGEA